MAFSPLKLLRLGSYLLCAAFLGAACLQSVAGLPAEGAPPLSLEKSGLNLGEIADRDSRVGQIVLTNVSTYPVSIDRVSATCGCTSATVTEAKIQPGETSVLNIELSPSGRRGNFGSVVTLEWTEKKKDGDRKGKIETKVEASGVYLVGAQPTNLDLGPIVAGSPSVENSVIVTRGTQKLDFSEIKVSSDSEYIRPRIEKRDKDSWALLIEFSSKKIAAGPFHSTVTMGFYNNSGEEVAWREFPVRAEIVGLVSVKPKTIFIGVLKQGERREGVVSFSVPEGKSPAIKRVYTDPKAACLAIGDEWKAADRTESAKISYSIVSDGRTGDQSGKLFVEFEDESLGSLSVPFVVHVK